MTKIKYELGGHEDRKIFTPDGDFVGLEPKSVEFERHNLKKMDGRDGRERV